MRGRPKINIPESKLRNYYWDEKMSLNEIAELLNISVYTVRSRMIEYGIPRRDNSYRKVNIPENKLRVLYCDERRNTVEIAEVFNVSAKTVLRRIKEYNIPRIHPNSYRKIDIPESELRKLYCDEKKSSTEIAEVFDTSAGTVLNRMKEYDIPRRHPSEKIDISESKLRRLYLDKKLTTYEIAEIFDTCDVTVRTHMKEYDIPRRHPNKKVEIPESKLKRLYWDEKKSSTEIAEVFDVAGSTIRRKMKEYDIPHRDEKIDISESKLKRLYINKGLNAYEIAEIFNVGHTTIYRRMKEYNIPRRDTKGKNNPNWKGGTEGHRDSNWYEQRRKALERDNYECKWCGKGKTEIGREPDVHHIIAYRISEDNSLDNLITLCPHHHKWIEYKTNQIITERGEAVISPYTYNIIEERGKEESDYKTVEVMNTWSVSEL